MIANLENLAKDAHLERLFQPGDRLICHPELAARFGSVATKTPAVIVSTTSLGVLSQDCVIVEMLDLRQANAEWRLKELKVMSSLKPGQAWVFTRGEDTRPNMCKGIVANLNTKGIKTSRLAVAIVPMGPNAGKPFQAYYFRRES